MNIARLNMLRWASFTVALILPLLAWGQLYSWDFASLSFYQVFPLLGLWAFCIMASHFIVGGVRTFYPGLANNPSYSAASGIVVLACLLLHPLLLAWQLFEDGQSLPPFSFYDFVGSGLKAYVVLGSTALFAFLAYEVLLRMRTKPVVKKYWFYILASQLVALIFIFIHAWGLGTIWNIGWFKLFWFVLAAATLVGGALTLKSEWAKTRGHKTAQ